MTNSLLRRIWEHKNKAVPGFTNRYNVDRLVYFEEYHRPGDAISREKQIKGYGRVKKVELIERENPAWQDLAKDLLGLE